MLARANRLRTSQDFRTTVRAGNRAASPTVVVHLVLGASTRTSAGFVVNKGVGPATVRNRVKRRLRHITAEHLGRLPVGTRLVVRALPRSAEASYATLKTDLGAALQRAGA